MSYERKVWSIIKVSNLPRMPMLVECSLKAKLFVTK
jgi:hypothetical protein